MAVTATAVHRNSVHGNQRVTVTDVVPAAYATGGIAIPAATLGLTVVSFGIASITTNVTTAGATVGSCAVLPQADGSILLKCNLTGGGEVTNATSLAATTIRVVVFGI